MVSACGWWNNTSLPRCPCPNIWNPWMFPSLATGKVKMWLQGHWDGEIILDYPGGPNVIMRHLKSDRWYKKRKQGKIWPRRGGQGDFMEGRLNRTLMAWWRRKGPQTKGCFFGKKPKEINFPLETLEGAQPANSLLLTQGTCVGLLIHGNVK